MSASTRASAAGEDRLLTAPEAAKLLRHSVDWVYRNKGKLPFTVRMGRRVLFDAGGLDRYIRQRQGHRG